MDNKLKINNIRGQFPILKKKIYKNNLIYFDNASSNQKPQSVINKIKEYYENFNSNVHRGIHYLSEKSTNALENTRESIKKIISSKKINEIIFTSGTTESINLIASAYGEKYIKKNDEIIISQMEHHANIVPWQILCRKKSAILKVMPIKKNGEINIDIFKKILNIRTKIVSVVYISNTLGVINPIKKIIKESHLKKAIVIIDGAQAVAHTKINVQKLNCDFFIFSSNKIYGPTGIGILYGKRKILKKMPIYKSGGEMIEKVNTKRTIYNNLPYKFETGTPNIANIIAFQESINFIIKIGIQNIEYYEKKLLNYLSNKIFNIKKVKNIGESNKKINIFSFIIKNIHHLDICILLDSKGIAVRTGHHCTQPLIKKFKINGVVRISLSIYNTYKEIDKFIEIINKI